MSTHRDRPLEKIERGDVVEVISALLHPSHAKFDGSRGMVLRIYPDGTGMLWTILSIAKNAMSERGERHFPLCGLKRVAHADSDGSGEAA